MLGEKDFFQEQNETKSANFSCPHCRQRADYEVRWIKRTKRKQLPSGANEQDRARFAKSRDYMIRVDDLLVCKSCRKRFEIPNSQSVVFI